MKKILFIIFLLCSSSQLFSQPNSDTKSSKARKSYIKGLNYRDMRDYNKAFAEIKNAIKKDPEYIDAYMLLAETYEMLRRDSLAVMQYLKVLEINPAYYPANYNLGMLEFHNGHYQSAKDNLESFIRKAKSINSSMMQLTMRTLANADFAIQSMKDPFPFNPISLGNNVNTGDFEYSPCLSIDGQTLFYTHRSNRDRPMHEDFYVAILKDSVWQKAVNLGPAINTEDNEGSASISADGRYLYFAAENRPGGYGSMDIYVSEKEGDRWGKPVNIGPPVNSMLWESQPSISSDGKTLYFTSKRPGGMGQDDIWISRRNDAGKWSKPVNAGPNINTEAVDQSPFIHADDQTLYFSSTGRIGMGEADLYVSRRGDNGEWQTPFNLGYPLNTNKHDFSLIVSADGRKGYYASMVNEQRFTDLFYFELYPAARPNAVSYVKGVVYDNATKQRLGAIVELTDLETGEIVVNSYSDPVTGEFMFALQGNRDYALNVARDGYLFHSENFSLLDASSIDPFKLNVPLMKIQVGAGVILKNIFFETASFQLKPESETEITKLYKLMMQNPGIRIELGGHTDSIGDKKYNQKLSENRAKSVADYLIKMGISKERITYKGYGDTQPSTSNSSIQGRALNRRTEFKIIGI